MFRLTALALVYFECEGPHHEITQEQQRVVVLAADKLCELEL